mgnify:FL=1|jgi:uncharacterized protein (DUF952 family)
MANMEDAHVYKLLTDDQWRAAEASGVTDVPIDREDGYVHFSTAEQVGETAAKYFSGLKDVRLVRFPVDRLPPLKWETSRGGQLFPHLYGRLQIAKADAVWRLARGEDGAPVMPEDLNDEPD